MGKLYDENSIESLDPLEFTRLRPGVYCGDTTYATQLLIEIFSNAVDEFQVGNATEISIIIDNDVVTIKDDGQGFLVNSIREDGKTVLEAAFSVLNTSGKYREDGTYEGTSLGSFGIGSKISNYLSNWLTVTTYRDGKSETIKFIEGKFDKREVNNKLSKENMHGTIVRWKPSQEFFTHTTVEINKVKDLFETISCLCKGLKIKLQIDIDNHSEYIEYYSKTGLNKLVDNETKDKELFDNRLELNIKDGKSKLDLIMTYTSLYSSNIIPYVNTGLTESGNHITRIKSAITREMNKFFRDKKWIKDKEDNLTGDDIQEGMFMIFNMTVPSVKYDAQVKSRVTGIECENLINIFTEEFKNWLSINEKQIKIIADKAISAKKAREAAKKAREAVRNNAKKKEKVLKFSSKLADCYGKDRSRCEIYITEGK